MLGASKLPERYGIGKTLFYQRRNYLIKLGYDLEPEKDGNKRKYRDEQIQLLDELNKYIRQNGGMEGFPCATVRDESGLVHTDSEQTERTPDHSSEGFSEATIGRESGFVRADSEQTDERSTEGFIEPTVETKNHPERLTEFTRNSHSSGLVHTDTEQTETKCEQSHEDYINNGQTFDKFALVRSKSEQTGIEREQTQKISVNTAPIADIKEHQLKSVDGAAQYSAAELLSIFNYRQLDYLKNRNFTIPGLAEEVQKSSDAVRKCFESMTGTPGESIKKNLEKLRQRDRQKAPSSSRS